MTQQPGVSGYDGEVSPGGDPQRRTAGSLEITKLAVDQDRLPEVPPW